MCIELGRPALPSRRTTANNVPPRAWGKLSGEHLVGDKNLCRVSRTPAPGKRQLCFTVSAKCHFGALSVNLRQPGVNQLRISATEWERVCKPTGSFSRPSFTFWRPWLTHPAPLSTTSALRLGAVHIAPQSHCQHRRIVSRSITDPRSIPIDVWWGSRTSMGSLAGRGRGPVGS